MVTLERTCCGSEITKHQPLNLCKFGPKVGRAHPTPWPNKTSSGVGRIRTIFDEEVEHLGQELVESGPTWVELGPESTEIAHNAVEPG